MDGFMSKVINAFSKEYVSTYMPEFLSTIRSESIAKLNGEKYGALNRIARESAEGHTAFTISDKSKKKKISLDPTNFYVYSKAGMPKGVK